MNSKILKEAFAAICLPAMLCLVLSVTACAFCLCLSFMVWTIGFEFGVHGLTSFFSPNSTLIGLMYAGSIIFTIKSVRSFSRISENINIKSLIRPIVLIWIALVLTMLPSFMNEGVNADWYC